MASAVSAFNALLDQPFSYWMHTGNRPLGNLDYWEYVTVYPPWWDQWDELVKQGGEVY